MPNINLPMTNFVCAVCERGDPSRITMFQGTVICLQCLEEIKKHNVESEKSLNDTVKQVVEYGMGDIYD